MARIPKLSLEEEAALSHNKGSRVSKIEPEEQASEKNVQARAADQEVEIDRTELYLRGPTAFTA